MYKLLVVEDEKIERETLMSILTKEFHSILEVQSVENGIEAIQKFSKFKPNVVLTDINMPGMNGLELIHQIKQENNDVVFIVLTSYNYFEYAQEAIKLGVEDFILKPASIESLRNSISSLVAKLDNNKMRMKQTSQLVVKMDAIKPIMERDCVHSIVEHADVKEIRHLFSVLNIKPKDGFCLVFQETTMKKNAVYQLMQEIEDLGYKCMSDSYYAMFVVFVFSVKRFMNDDIEVLETIINEKMDDLGSVGVGEIYNECEFFYESYIKAIHHIGKHVELVRAPLKLSGTVIDQFGLNKLCITIVKSFLNTNDQKANDELHLFYLQVLDLDAKQLKQKVDLFQVTLIQIFNQEFHASIQENAEEYKIIVDENNPHEHLEDKLNYVVDNLRKTLSKQSVTSTNRLVKKATAYIALNYTKPITLKQVAEYLEVTPFYISKLLSDHTKKNFTDLVTEFRIEKSKEILKEERQIKEIASELGFQSHNYFSKVFKKVTGMTPKEYKDQL